MGIRANLGFAGSDLLVGHSPLLQLRDQPLDGRSLFANHQIGGEVERRLPQQLFDDLPAQRLALFGLDFARQGFVHRLTQLVCVLDTDRIKECFVQLGMPHPFQIVDLDLDADGRAPQLGVFARPSRAWLRPRESRPAGARRAHAPIPLIVPFWKRSSE